MRTVASSRQHQAAGKQHSRGRRGGVGRVYSMYGGGVIFCMERCMERGVIFGGTQQHYPTAHSLTSFAQTSAATAVAQTLNAAANNMEHSKRYARPSSTTHPAGHFKTPRSKRRNERIPAFQLDERLAALGHPIQRAANGRLPELSVADLRACLTADRYHFNSTRFTRHYLRFSEPLPTFYRPTASYSGLTFNGSPFRLDRVFDWRYIAHSDRAFLLPTVNYECRPWWGTTNSGLGYVAFGEAANPLFAFCRPQLAAHYAAIIAAEPRTSWEPIKQLQRAFEFLPADAPDTDYIVEARPAYAYRDVLLNAFPPSPDNTITVSRQRALYISKRDFKRDITFNVALMVFCDMISKQLRPQCLDIYQLREYAYVWKRLPERPVYNAHWTDIIHHSSAPQYSGVRTIVQSDNAWDYAANAPDSANYR